MIRKNINKTQLELIRRIGFWAAILSTIFYVAFDIAAIGIMAGSITSKYWISILSYTPSLFLALSFVVLMVSIHHYAPEEVKVLSQIGMMFSIIYATLNCFIYISQILIIAPSLLNGQYEKVALFDMAPGKPLYAVNALAYTLMSLSTLFASFAFRGKGLTNWIRIFLRIHGFVAPTIVGVLIWQPFFYLSASVGITYPVSAILIAVFFKNNIRESRGRYHGVV